MKIIVGLGNPGVQYANTPHSVGFEAVEAIAASIGAAWELKKSYNALLARGTFAGQSVLLVKPQTYMNLSGEAVIQAAKFYKISPEHIIVVSDEVAMPIGKLRIRKSGSAGGHNGLKNIIQHLGTQDFPRIRMGVGAAPHPDYDMADWVLSTFKNKDAEDMQALAERVSKAVQCYIIEGPDRAMNKFN